MAQIHARLNDVDPWGGEGGALPPGEYVFVIDKAAQGQSKNGKPQLEVDLKVINEGELKGRTTKQWYTLNFEKDAPRKRLKALVLATGIQLDQNGDFDDSQLPGATFCGDVQVEPYEVDDPISGKKLQKERTRIINERPANAFGGGGAAATPPAAAGGAAPGGGFTPNAPGGAAPAQGAAPQYPAPAGAPAPARGNPLTPVGQ